MFPADKAEEGRQPPRSMPGRLLSTTGDRVFEDSPESIGKSLVDLDVP